MKPAARRGWRALASLVVLAALLFLGVQLVTDWNSVEDAVQTYLIGGLLIALALGLAARTLTALAWRSLVKGMGVRIRVGDALGVYFLSRIGVYLPGSLWPTYAEQRLRLDLRVSSCVSAKAHRAHAAVQILTAVGLAGLAVIPAGNTGWLARLVILALVLSLLVPRVATRITAPAGSDSDTTSPSRPTTRATLAAISLQALSWVFYGLTLTALVAPFNPMEPGDLGRLVGIAGIAWTIGRLGERLSGHAAPDGLGYRDLALWAGLQGFADPGAAALVTLLFRLLTTVSDTTLASMASTSTSFRVWREHQRPRGLRT